MDDDGLLAASAAPDAPQASNAVEQELEEEPREEPEPKEAVTTEADTTTVATTTITATAAAVMSRSSDELDGLDPVAALAEENQALRAELERVRAARAAGVM
jgi:hypothetical protein